MHSGALSTLSIRDPAPKTSFFCQIRAKQKRPPSPEAFFILFEGLKLFGCGCRGAAAGCFLLLSLFAGFLDKRFATQANLVVFDRKHLDQNLVAELQLV